MQKRIELLAPAGNMESLMAAVAGGCDAVYLGLTNFSARAFAGNFTHEEYLEAISYCHIRNVKVYVTLNTLVYESEFDSLCKEVTFLYENDVDAILVQDYGLFHWIKTVYPSLEVHCSTQMHIHNVEGVEWAKSIGASRVVLARETPIEIVKECCQTGMEIEVFAYGALCISYSGQCLMSHSTNGRSGNRGTCAQLCRMPYRANPSQENEYLLSPKDLNLIEQVPEFIKAGVHSIKIEGRMKRPEYVYLVTKRFREAIDAYYRNEEYHLTESKLEQLQLLFHRGFTLGHLFHSSPSEMMSQYRPNHIGIPIGKVQSYTKNTVTVTLEKELHQHDGLRIIHKNHDIGLTAVTITDRNGNYVNHASPNETVTLQYNDSFQPSVADILYKTTDTLLMDQIQKEIQQANRKIPIQIQYKAHIDQPFQLEITDGTHTVNVQSNEFCQPAKQSPLSKERIEQALNKVKDTPYTITSYKGEIEDIFLPISIINQVRRDALEKLSLLRSKYHLHRKEKKEYRIELPYKPLKGEILIQNEVIEGENIISCGEGDSFDYELLPVVQERPYIAHNQHVIFSQPGDMIHEEYQGILGMSFHCTNHYALAFFLSIPNIHGCILSSELTTYQANQLIDGFEKHFGYLPNTYQMIYGKRTLMVIKNGIDDTNLIQSLEDTRKKVYPLMYRNHMMELIEDHPYEREPASNCGYYLVKTDETRQTIEGKVKNIL